MKLVDFKPYHCYKSIDSEFSFVYIGHNPNDPYNMIMIITGKHFSYGDICNDWYSTYEYEEIYNTEAEQLAKLLLF